jgi:hypothetical protein
MNTWSTSNYRSRKAIRQASRPAEWVTNPETQESFLIRPTGAIGFTLAGYLPHSLKQDAGEAWKEQGIEAESDDNGTQTAIDSTQLKQLNRANELVARLIYDACVIPTMVAEGESSASVKERALRNCEAAWGNTDEWKNATEEERLARAAEVVMDLSEMEDSDVKFLTAAIREHQATVAMKGGATAKVADIKMVPKKPGRRIRTGTGG